MNRGFLMFRILRLTFQAEVNCGQRRELNVQAPLAVLPRNVLRPDFAEVTHVGAAEHASVSVEDFLPLAAGRSAEAVVVADHRREVEYAQNLVSVVVLTHKAHDGIVGIVAPDPFKACVVVVDFPERGVFLVQVVQNLHHLQELAMAIPADEVPVKRTLLVPFAELPELVAHEVEFLARVRILESVGEAEVCKLLPVVTRHLA